MVNVVDDLGLDPNGNEPIQNRLNNADQSGTLFVFPEGEYLVTDRLLMLSEDTVGVLGRGDVRFTVPKWFNDWAVIIDHGKRALFENVDIDLRAKGATPGCRFGGYDDVQVHDVEYVGQGLHPGGNNVNAALGLIARSSGAEVLAENVVARNKGRMGAYNRGNGRAGVWVGQSSKGTVTLRGCEFSEFPNNGLYTSRTPGVVQVEGGVFRNNDISQVRLGSEGSYVKNALIEVDPSTSNSPNPEDMLNGRGVRIESGPVDTAGVTVEDCDIHIAEGADSQGGVVAARPSGMFDVVNTRIKVDTKRTPAVLGRIPDGGGAYNTPPRPHRARLVNVSVTGDARRGAAIVLRSRPESVVRSCCIEQRSGRRTGVTLVNSDRSVVRESTLNVAGEAVGTERTNANVWGNSTSGSCPLPGNGGASTSGTGSSGGNGRSKSNDSSGGKRLELSGNKHPVKYWVKVSGEINETDVSERGEAASNNTASGWVGGGVDAFTFTGRIERLVVKGKMTFRYNRSSGSANVFWFGDNNTGRGMVYSARASGDFDRTGTLEGGDSAWTDGSDGRVKGYLGGGGWKDAYRCRGELRSASFNNSCEITVTTD